MGLFSLFHSEKFISSFLFVSIWRQCSYKSIVSQVTFYCKSRIIFSIEEPDIKWENFSFFWKINQLKLNDHTSEFSQNHQNCMLRENGSTSLCFKNRTPALLGVAMSSAKNTIFPDSPHPQEGWHFLQLQPRRRKSKSLLGKLLERADPASTCLLPFAFCTFCPPA